MVAVAQQQQSAQARVKAATERAAPVRQGNGWLLGTTIAISLVVGIIPIIGPVISHFVERISNSIKANRELDARAHWYRDEIATILSISPRKVKGKHLEQAAALNPQLAAAVRDVNDEKSKENNISMAANAAIAFIPAGHLVKEAVGAAKFVAGAKHAVKVVGATTASGMLLSWGSKDHMSTQAIAEDINIQLAAAKEQGVDLKSAVTPQMLFMLRVSQDEHLAAEIKQRWGKPMHKLDEGRQIEVMHTYASLANAAATEAHAIANKLLTVQEVVARAPNLSGTARYQFGTQATTFAAREDARRNIARGDAANDKNFVGRVSDERAAAALSVNKLQA